MTMDDIITTKIYSKMTTLSSMNIINDNGIINYKVVFEKTYCIFKMF